jgi:hypothetical protein
MFSPGYQEHSQNHSALRSKYRSEGNRSRHCLVGERARRVVLKAIARWTAASAIAALWIQTFLYAWLPAE